MRTVHWSLLNTSGMHAVAASMARAELTLGVESKCLDPFDATQTDWEWALDADVHISHTHIPDQFKGKSFRRQCTKPYRWVFPVHGTPELVFEMSVKDAETNGYNTGTSYAQHQIGMQTADAIFAFVPRHRDLYDLATDKHTIVDLIPMGIDVPFWQGGTNLGKYAGNPSFFTCENQYPFKWGVELLRTWPWVRAELDDAYLHVTHVPTHVLQILNVMTARYGSLYGAIVGSWSYDHLNLRNIFKQIDYYVSPVRYGDFNRLSLEAGVAGARVISYPGNEYADYWMTEGDQRRTAKDLIAIGRGDVAPREKTPIPTERQMAEAAINVYERILDRPRTLWALGQALPDALDRALIDAQLSATGPGLNEATPAGPRPAALTASEVRSIMASADTAAAQVGALAGDLASVEVPA